MPDASKDYGRLNWISTSLKPYRRFDFSYPCLYNLHKSYVILRKVRGRSISFAVGGLEMKVSPCNFNRNHIISVSRPGR